MLPKGKKRLNAAASALPPRSLTAVVRRSVKLDSVRSATGVKRNVRTLLLGLPLMVLGLAASAAALAQGKPGAAAAATRAESAEQLNEAAFAEYQAGRSMATAGATTESSSARRRDWRARQL